MFRNVPDNDMVQTCFHMCKNFYIFINNCSDSVGDKGTHRASASGFGQKYINILCHSSHFELYFNIHSSHSLPCVVCLIVYLLTGYAVKELLLNVKDKRKVLNK